MDNISNKGDIWKDKELVFNSKRRKTEDLSRATKSTNVSGSPSKRKVSFTGVEFIDIKSYKEFNMDISLVTTTKPKDSINCVCILF
jgi:hypothetical protein